MTIEEKKEIVKASKAFARGFKDIFGPIEESLWFIVDPLSGYLNACGTKNTLSQLEGNAEHPQILIMEFEDGSKLIPGGSALRHIYQKAKNWMWI